MFKPLDNINKKRSDFKIDYTLGLEQSYDKVKTKFTGINLGNISHLRRMIFFKFSSVVAVSAQLRAQTQTMRGGGGG